MEKPIIFESEGKNLIGILHLSEFKNSPVVVLFHGFTGQKSESHFIFTRLARLLCKEKISVLRFDFMGSGDSEGEFSDMTLYTEMKDGENALRYIKELENVNKEKIGILGLSMGAVTASYIASEFNTTSLCLWSPVAYPSVISRRLTRKIKKQLQEKGKAYLPGTGLYISDEFIKSTKEVKPLRFAGKYKGSVLIIHCKDDTVLPVEHALAYFKKFHQQSRFSQLTIFEKGGHTFTVEETEKEVLNQTVNFFKTTLWGGK
ncbi:MAG TPA: alpha/beta hydrolase [bacterium]|nr:alpha/beta hydrolase [bacterium]HOM26870.1 alpha/beta hydrolase [bacterium]